MSEKQPIHTTCTRIALREEVRGLAETKPSLSKKLRCTRYQVIDMSPGEQRRELAHEIILTQFDRHSSLKREARDIS